MKEYSKLIMGLISGFALILLNMSIVHDSIINVVTLFNPIENNSELFLGLVQFMSRTCVLLSFIGIFIVILSVSSILKTVIFSKK